MVTGTLVFAIDMLSYVLPIMLPWHIVATFQAGPHESLGRSK